MKKALAFAIGGILILAGVVWYNSVNGGKAYEPKKSPVTSETAAGTSAAVNIAAPIVVEQTESKTTDTRHTLKLEIAIPTRIGTMSGYAPPLPGEPDDNPPDGTFSLQ